MKAGMKVLTVSVLAVEFPLVCLHVLKLKLSGSLSGPHLLLLNPSSSMVHCSFYCRGTANPFSYVCKKRFCTAITHKISKSLRC